MMTNLLKPDVDLTDGRTERRLAEELKQRRHEHGQRLQEEAERQRKAADDAAAKARAAERTAYLMAKWRPQWIAEHPLTPPSEFDKATIWKPYVEEHEAAERQQRQQALRNAARL